MQGGLWLACIFCDLFFYAGIIFIRKKVHGFVAASVASWKTDVMKCVNHVTVVMFLLKAVFQTLCFYLAA